MKRISKFKTKAKETAASSNHKFQVGTVLVKKNRIISTATNLNKTHPVQASFAKMVGKPHKHWLHAETNALIRSDEDADEAYVCRLGKSGELRNAKPCPICQEALRQSSVSKVYYSVDGGWEYMTL